MIYYIINIVINACSRFCIWYSGDIDGLVVQDKLVMSFESISQLYDYGNSHNLSLQDDDIFCVDYDIILESLDSGRVTEPGMLLNGWNMLSDFASSVNVRFIGDEEEFSTIYDKLFRGCNLPAFNKNKGDFIVFWTPDEISKIRTVVLSGVKIIADNCGI